MDFNKIIEGIHFVIYSCKNLNLINKQLLFCSIRNSNCFRITAYCCQRKNL